jgi:hypothetical protein
MYLKLDSSWRFDVSHWGRDTVSVFRHNLGDEEFKGLPLAAMVFTSFFMIYIPPCPECMYNGVKPGHGTWRLPTYYYVTEQPVSKSRLGEAS